MFGSICLAGVVFVSYAKFAKVLKFGTLMLLVYVIVAFAVHAPAREILAGSFIPKILLGGGCPIFTASPSCSTTSVCRQNLLDKLATELRADLVHLG